MARREGPGRAHLPKQSADVRGARTPSTPTRNERCLGAAVQLAAVHRLLRHGPALELETRGAAAPARAPADNRTGLPDRLKGGIEALSGISLDGVKVHYNSSKPAQLDALAYAQGGDIHLAPGQEKHLPHEAWHVVQQAQGRVKPTLQMKDGVRVNDDAGLEREADLMGPKGFSAVGVLTARHDLETVPAHGPIQRIVARDGRIWSSFDEKYLIDSKQALITTGSRDTADGGHAIVILEYSDGLAKTSKIDLRVSPSGTMKIDIVNQQTEVKPQGGVMGFAWSLVGLNPRTVEGRVTIPELHSSHKIKNSKALDVLAKAIEYSSSINKSHYYSYSSTVFTSNIQWGKRPINCATFAGMLLEVGGVKSNVLPPQIASIVPAPVAKIIPSWITNILPSWVAAKKSGKEETQKRFEADETDLALMEAGRSQEIVAEGDGL